MQAALDDGVIMCDHDTITFKISFTRECWSGKTFEPQRVGVQGAPPVLSILGSQRFAHINPQERGHNVHLRD